MMVGLPEVGKLYLTPQTLCLFIVHNHESAFMRMAVLMACSESL